MNQPKFFRPNRQAYFKFTFFKKTNHSIFSEVNTLLTHDQNTEIL